MKFAVQDLPFKDHILYIFHESKKLDKDDKAFSHTRCIDIMAVIILIDLWNDLASSSYEYAKFRA